MYALANVLGGIGFGFINPVLIALITDVTPKPDIAKKMGFLGAVASLGVGLGPLIAGQMVRYGWRSIYILFVVVTVCGIIAFAELRRHHRSEGIGGGLQVLLNHLSVELRRPVVILLVLTAFFVPLTYLAILIWTARALTGIINEATIGIILSMVGFSGAAAGISMGYIMKRWGVLIAIATGLVTLLIGVLILIGMSDFTAIGGLIYVAVALLLIGFAGGMLFPAVIFYSQVISPERSGTLAGAVTAFQFTGVALVPFIYAPFFVQSIKAVYLAILVASIMLILIITALYFVARRMLQ
jgi:DHA1 family tetracycline resistance protein-like MFS transporter